VCHPEFRRVCSRRLSVLEVLAAGILIDNSNELASSFIDTHWGRVVRILVTCSHVRPADLDEGSLLRRSPSIS